MRLRRRYNVIYKRLPHHGDDMGLGWKLYMEGLRKRTALALAEELRDSGTGIYDFDIEQQENRWWPRWRAS